MIGISQRKIWLLMGIALTVIVLITLLVAPAKNQRSIGSTYSRAPDGYGAWYAFMIERGTPIQRWQKPFEALENEEQSPITLLQVYSRLRPELLPNSEGNWVSQGNTLIILGVKQSVTEAAFSHLLESPVGQVKIETRRRNKDVKKALLKDEFGAIFWVENVGKGQIIYGISPYLGANAYQDFPGNYEFLAQLVAQPGNSLWVDEYLHGYKDSEVIEQEIGDNLFSYLGQTPLLPFLVQGLVILLVSLWAGNRRFGRAVTLSTPRINNSEAYIRALAAVLQKADSRDFVQSAIASQEKRQK